MPILNQSSIDKEYLKMRWKEPYVTHGLNRKFFGIFPKGIYSGFYIGAGVSGPRDIIISGSVSGLTSVSGSVSGISIGSGMVGGYVSGAFDETVGWSIAVQDDVNGYSKTISIPPGPNSIIHLNATGLDGRRVYIVIDSSYMINNESTVMAQLVDGPYIDQDPSLLVLGYVDVPSDPSVPLDNALFGYNDPTYPRLLPISTPKKTGLMPFWAWDMIQDPINPWTRVLLMDVDTNPYVVTITPSQGVAQGHRFYTYVQVGISSKFPRDATNKYNGGPNDDNLAKLNILTGVIGGAHQIPSNQNFLPPSVSGTPNAFQAGLVTIDANDHLSVTYGQIFTSAAEAMLDDNLPIVGPPLLQIGTFLVATDASGSILPLINQFVTNPISWRRPFLNIGGDGVSNFPDFFQEQLSGLVNGVNAVFTTSATPLNANSLMVVVDGQVVPEGNWSLSGNQVTLGSSYIPTPGQDVYAYYVTNSQSTISGFQEIPTGAVDGLNTLFSLSGNPANKASLIVMVDGRIANSSTWKLIEGSTGSQIQFNSDSIPLAGQDIYCYYLVNLSSIGTGPEIGLLPFSQFPVLTSTDITNKFVTLSKAPFEPSSVLLDIAGMGAQIYGFDYTVAGQTLSWAGMNLDGVITTSNKMRIYFLYGTTSGAGPIAGYYTLTTTDIANKYVVLGGTPSDPTSVLLDVISSTSQIYGVDYTVSGNKLSWAGLGLDGILAAGMKLRTYFVL